MPHMRFKRHCKLLVLLTLLVTGLVVGAGDQPIVAYSMQEPAHLAESILSYGHTLAGLLSLDGDGIQISGSIDTSGAGNLP